MIYPSPNTSGAPLQFKAKYDNFIGGKFVAPTKGVYFDVVTPITGKPYTQAARSSAEDIELALDAAHAAADRWGKTSAAERGNILLKIADRLEANLELLAYAETVLGLTGLDSLFAAVYSVESLNFQPKPMLAAYRNLLRVERLSPRRCIMVEDSLANLVTAKTLGMKTVWVSTGLRDSPSVDVKVRSVRELPRHLNRL